MRAIITRFARTQNQDKKLTVRIKPVAILIVLTFLFLFNCIVIYSYEHGLERTHFNILIYMYVNFWMTFFLLAYQVKRISKSIGESKKRVSSSVS
jgi:putative effector of murein hydrolase LrgA (UPF0299 family)